MTWAMRSGRPHRASGELASHYVDVMQALIESADEHRQIETRDDVRTPGSHPSDLPEDAFDD